VSVITNDQKLHITHPHRTLDL